MKEMKKILAFFLCFVMVLGFVPTNAFAEGGEAVEQNSDVVYVLAGSDFQPTDGKTATGVELLNKILAG